ncbi:Uncharacterized protein Fot_41984 [Forsythia ovata]|uniref:Uncharacterized protein n=1 Tax=Forsythia ovata TaxID=205694 RepID=A0ABD1RJX1_9LAMI
MRPALPLPYNISPPFLPPTNFTSLSSQIPHSSNLFIEMEKHHDNHINITIKFFLLFIVLSAKVSHAAPPTSTTSMDNPTAVQLVTHALFSRFSNFSALFSDDILKELGYCISNV